MTAPPRVAIVQSTLRQYRRGFYVALQGELEATGVDLRLVHSNQRFRPEFGAELLEPFGTDAIDVPCRVLPVRDRKLMWQSALPQLHDVDLVVVEQASQLMLNYALLARQELRGRPRVAFWGHGRNFKATPSRGGEAVKRWMSRQAHWWFAYTPLAVDAVADLGYPRERITLVQNAIDTRSLALAVDAVDRPALAACRTALDLPDDAVVGVFVGRLEARKGLDYLLRAAERVRMEVPQFTLVIVGRGPDESLVAEAARRHAWVRYAGPLFGDAFAALLKLARLLLVPKWVGLVAVDSFAGGLPLVASASGPHPPEIAYLKDGVNGRLVDDGGDPFRYAAAIVELLRDEDARSRLVQGCLTARREFTAETMAARFADGLRQALAAPPCAL